MKIVIIELHDKFKKTHIHYILLYVCVIKIELKVIDE